MTTHSYDYLDQREPYFNHHVKEFEARLSDMKLCIGTWIERNYDPVWETPQGMTFLHKFEKIGSLVPLIPLDNKHLRILSYLSDDFDRIWRILELNGSCPPVPKNFSLAAGECRHFQFKKKKTLNMQIMFRSRAGDVVLYPPEASGTATL